VSGVFGPFSSMRSSAFRETLLGQRLLGLCVFTGGTDGQTSLPSPRLFLGVSWSVGRAGILLVGGALRYPTGEPYRGVLLPGNYLKEWKKPPWDLMEPTGGDTQARSIIPKLLRSMDKRHSKMMRSSELGQGLRGHFLGTLGYYRLGLKDAVM
jgi:hypothetical protein